MKEKWLRIKNSRTFHNLLPIITFIVLAMAFAIGTGGRIINKASINTIVNQAMLLGIISTGAVFVFASGNVNIAMGGTTVVSAIVACLAYNATESIAVMFLTSVAVGIGIMGVACMASVIFKVGFMISTMIFMTILASVQVWMLNIRTVSIPFAVSSGLSKANVPILIWIAFFLFCTVIFQNTKIGRSIRMVGENPINALQTGISVKKHVIIAHLLAGLGAGLGGLIILMRSSSVTESTGAGANMDVMLAIVLGGMPVTGGYKSKIYAGLIGALIISILNTGCLLMGVDAMFIQAVKGVFFIILIFMANKRSSTLLVREIL